MPMGGMTLRTFRALRGQTLSALTLTDNKNMRGTALRGLTFWPFLD